MTVRQAIVGLAAGAVFVFGGCGGDNADPSGSGSGQSATEAEQSRARPAPIAAGTTTLKLSRTLELGLTTAGGEVTALAPARKTDRGFELPISSGRAGVKPLAGKLRHDGGVRLGAGSNTVDVTAVVLDLSSGDMTAEVGGSRLRLLRTDLAPAELAAGGAAMSVSGDEAELTEEAVAPLNEALGLELLSGGLSIGELRVQARWP